MLFSWWIRFWQSATLRKLPVTVIGDFQVLVTTWRWFFWRAEQSRPCMFALFTPELPLQIHSFLCTVEIPNLPVSKTWTCERSHDCNDWVNTCEGSNGLGRFWPASTCKTTYNLRNSESTCKSNTGTCEWSQVHSRKLFRNPWQLEFAQKTEKAFSLAQRNSQSTQDTTTLCLEYSLWWFLFLHWCKWDLKHTPLDDHPFSLLCFFLGGGRQFCIQRSTEWWVMTIPWPADCRPLERRVLSLKVLIVYNKLAPVPHNLAGGFRLWQKAVATTWSQKFMWGKMHFCQTGSELESVCLYLPFLISLYNEITKTILEQIMN